VNAMTLGIGTDIIAISRMKNILETSGQIFVDKVFTPYEQAQSSQHADRAAYLAMTFAAKEAIFKTLGIGWESGVQFKEIEVRNGEWGEPIALLTGRFFEVVRERGALRVLLSLSYDGDYAIAVAALSSEPPAGPQKKVN